MKLERELSKDEILERYLNTIYFGRGAYGVNAAARAYFDKDVDDIGLLEASYLAGLIRSPEGADALENPEEATRRRLTVLDGDGRRGLHRRRGPRRRRRRRDRRPVSSSRQDRQGLGRVEGNTADDNIGTKYFVEAVRRQIADRYGEEVLYGGGLRIYTTIDFELQRAAWDAVTSTLDQPTDPDAALVAVDQYGYVKAMVGGRDFETDEVNLALGAQAGGSGRGAGSSFKPFVLAEAIRQDISLNSKFDAPATITFDDVQGAKPGEPWKVSNYGDTEQGVLDLVDATRVSSNTAYAQLMLEVGPGNVATLANRLGVSAELPGRAGRSCSAAATSRRSTWPWATAPSPTAGVHNDPIFIAKIEQVDESGDVSVIEQAVPTGRAGALRGGGRPRHLLPRGGRAGRHRRVGGLRQAGGRQDRHDPGQQGRLVRRLHPQAHRGGVARVRGSVARRQRPHHGRGLSGQHQPRAQRRHRRQPAGRDLAEVHGGGHRGRRHRLVRASRPSSRATCSTRSSSRRPPRRRPRPPAPRPRAPRRPPCRRHDHHVVVDTTSTTEPTTDPADDHATRARRRRRRLRRGGAASGLRAALDAARGAGAGSWSGTGSTSARRCRAPPPSPPGPTPRG